MKIHALETGTVQIHKRQTIGVGNGLVRTANMILDNEWTPPLPIYVWAIEHPEGVIVVDTGITARVTASNYLPRFHPFFRRAVKFSIQPEQEIGPQLEQLNIRPSDVRTVILTHLHSDHAGGLNHFPTSEILVHPAELAATRGMGGYISGYLRQHFPPWFKPKSIQLVNEKFGAFGASQRVTRAGDIVIVRTYGHTPAHVSVIVLDGDTHYFLGGDTSYSEKNLRAELVDGVSPNVAQSAATMKTILAHARLHPTVYLPTHDPDSRKRLEGKTVLFRQ